MLNDQEILKQLEAFQKGSLTKEDLLKQLKGYESGSGFMVDLDRKKRTGCVEVIYCEGKSVEDVLRIGRLIVEKHNCLLATRISEAQKKALVKEFPGIEINEKARVARLGRNDSFQQKVAILCAGTSDLYVAEEAKETAYFLGAEIETLYDCGVAGIHRLIGNLSIFKDAKAIVVAAGMEGALASVVGGLVSVPVVAVPTSVGYGASFGGVAALLAMLNSCANGISVVNIDNGFGAGYNAAMIARQCK